MFFLVLVVHSCIYLHRAGLLENYISLVDITATTYTPEREGGTTRGTAHCPAAGNYRAWLPELLSQPRTWLHLNSSCIWLMAAAVWHTFSIQLLWLFNQKISNGWAMHGVNFVEPAEICIVYGLHFIQVPILDSDLCMEAQINKKKHISLYKFSCYLLAHYLEKKIKGEPC